MAVDGYNVKLSGTNNYEETKDSDVNIITAGVPRKPGMSRDDLLGTNLKIIKQVAEGIKDTSPNAFVICITNPLDVIVMALQKYSNFPKEKVIGMAGILDTSRFKHFIAEELNSEIKNVNSFVLGGHGDTMVPVPNRTTINSKPLNDFIKDGSTTQERIDSIIDRTRKGGAEIVKYLKTGSAFYAPAASGVAMAESYLKNQKKTLPCAAYLNGEYGIKDLYVGVPVIIGEKGIEKIIELKLDADEQKSFQTSIDAVKELFNAAKKIDPSLA